MVYTSEAEERGVNPMVRMNGCLMVSAGEVHHSKNLRLAVADTLEESLDIGQGPASGLDACVKASEIHADPDLIQSLLNHHGVAVI